MEKKVSRKLCWIGIEFAAIVKRDPLGSADFHSCALVSDEETGPIKFQSKAAAKNYLESRGYQKGPQGLYVDNRTNNRYRIQPVEKKWNLIRGMLPDKSIEISIRKAGILLHSGEEIIASFDSLKEAQERFNKD